MRLKLIAGNLIIVLLMGLGSYLAVRTQLRAELVRELKDGIGDDSELFGRSWRADGARLAEGLPQGDELRLRLRVAAGFSGRSVLLHR